MLFTVLFAIIFRSLAICTMLYQLDNFSYDSTNGVVFKKAVEIELSNIQNKLLNYLIQNPNTVLSKQTLMDDVWGRVVSDNSVDQIILALRNILEQKPTKPEIIITHFGKGVSFESTIHITDKKTNPFIKYGAFGFSLILILFLSNHFFSKPVKPIKESPIDNSAKLNQLFLILPTKFKDLSINQVQQIGMNEVLKSSINNSDSHDKIVFDEISENAQQAIEKHWQQNKELTVISTNVIRNGEIYEAVINLTKGAKPLQKTILKADSISHLLQKQISYISSYNQASTSIDNAKGNNYSLTKKYIEAIGNKQSGDLDTAKALLIEILSRQENHHQARLSLAETLIDKKEYDQAESQLNTLKATSAYPSMATEIEIDLAKINYANKEYSFLINTLKKFSASQLSIDAVKKSEIQLYIAKAYHKLGDIKNALKFYQQALIGIDKLTNPSTYAESYYGQAKALQAQSNNQNVLELFEQSLQFAQSAGDIHQQVLALNELSNMALSSYDWDKAISLKKQALQIMELDNDKEEIANGLGSLVAILNIRGNFSEAKQVNMRIKNIAEELDSDDLRLHYLHYDAVLAMNFFDWKLARQKIDLQLQIAKNTKNIPMQLDNAFLEMELLLLLKDTKNFEATWNERAKLIKEYGFNRYQIYMDIYLIRYYNLVNRNKDAIVLIEQTSNKARSIGDISALTDAQNQLAEIYLKTDAQKALEVLNNLEQYSPQANPYLEIKARVLNKLGKHIEALNVLNQAKLVYNESWTAQNQALLDTIQYSIQ